MSDNPDVILYTDGACSGNPGPGGWAAILFHPRTGKIKRLSGGQRETTNNRMELTAVIEGLRAIKADRRWRVKVISDSEYVVNGMTRWLDGWLKNHWRRGSKPGSGPVKNADLWQALVEQRERFELTFEHVRSHAGHPENEECDRMAVEASLRAAQGEFD